MKVSDNPATLFATFDDPDLIAHAGLVPTIPAGRAVRAGRSGGREGEGDRREERCRTAAEAKVMSIVGGTVAGADSIDDLEAGSATPPGTPDRSG